MDGAEQAVGDGCCRDEPGNELVFSANARKDSTGSIPQPTMANNGVQVRVSKSKQLAFVD